MKAARRGLERAVSVARYVRWRLRLHGQAREAQLAGQDAPAAVSLLDADFARRMPDMLRIFDDAELNGTSRAAWTVEGGRLVLSGRVGGENAEHMERMPFCGLEVRWPVGLDLSGFDLMRVTARCNLPVRVALRPKLLIADNEMSAALDCPAGGTHEAPLRLLRDTSPFAFDEEEMLLFNALRLSVSSPVSAPFRLELDRLEGVSDSSTPARAEMQRVSRFYPAGYWQDVQRRKRDIDSGGRARGASEGSNRSL